MREFINNVGIYWDINDTYVDFSSIIYENNLMCARLYSLFRTSFSLFNQVF